MRLAALLSACLAAATPANAAITAATLGEVAVDAPPSASVPLGLRFVDERGVARTLGAAIGRRPAVLVFADYTCTNLCGPILAFAAAGLEKTGLTPGRDYRLVVVGLDPKDSRAAAQTMKTATLGSNTPLAEASVFLNGTQDAIHAATRAVGYHYVYDPDHDQFAHPAAAFVVTAQGRVVRVLSGLGLSGVDLRLALTDAGEGRVGTLLDQIRLRCFGFDPAKGIYTATISRLLMVGGAAIMLAFVFALALMLLRPAWRARS
jgi:protein SCO1/2